MEFIADGMHLALLKMAKEGSRLITTVGSVMYECTKTLPSEPVAFRNTKAQIVSLFNF